MSWDISVADFGSYASIDELPEDFRLPSLGPRASIVEKMLEVVPRANFSDPTWGLIDTEDGSIEVNIGREDPIDGFMLHVRGGPRTLDVVLGLLHALDLRGIDCQSGEFLDPDQARKSFDRWRGYRDQVIRKGGP
jgi:hypothetical protein